MLCGSFCRRGYSILLMHLAGGRVRSNREGCHGGTKARDRPLCCKQTRVRT